MKMTRGLPWNGNGKWIVWNSKSMDMETLGSVVKTRVAFKNMSVYELIFEERRKLLGKAVF